MELVNRYLHSVEILLPRKQRRDIIDELSEDLRSQMEERESALGRKLNEAEVAEFLKQRGHPTRVAGLYLPQQYLIGPTLLPIYYFVLKIVLLWILAPLFGIIALGAIFAPPQVASALGLAKFLWSIWSSLFYATGIITLIFAILERFHIADKSFETWDPRRLPRVPVLRTADEPVSRLTSGSELMFGLLSAFIWVYVIRLGTSFDLGSGVRLSLDPVWQRSFWPMLLIWLSSAAAAGVNLARPSWTLFRSSARLAIHLAMLALVSFLFNAEAGVGIVSAKLSSTEIAEAAKWIDFGVWITLAIIWIVSCVEVVKEAFRIYRKMKI